MAQQVNSVPNPNYAVSPLTTVAGSIVSRRRVKIPANENGIYGHQKSTNKSTIVFDIADNECFADLSKLVFVFDFHTDTPTGCPFPNFDGSVQSIIAKVTLGSSQGLKIEEIHQYNVLCNMIQNFSETSLHKEHNLTERSNFSKVQAPEFSDGCSFYDSFTYTRSTKLENSSTYRLHIRFHQSSFLNRVKMLPLFLFRNGFRIEIDLDDFHRSFVYNTCPSVNSMHRVPSSYNATTELNTFHLTGGEWDAEGNFLQPHYVNLNDDAFLTTSHFNLALYVPAEFCPIQFVNIPSLYDIVMPFYITKNFQTESNSQQEQLIFSGFVTTKSKKQEKYLVNTVDEPSGYLIPNAGGREFIKLYASSFIPTNNLNLELGGGKDLFGTTLYFDTHNIIIHSGTVSSINIANTYLPGNGYAMFKTFATGFDDLRTSFQNSSGYTITNPELILDLVKPSSDEFLKYTQAFQSPSGIPYNYKRIILKQKVISAPGNSSFIQVPIDLSVRSLTGVLFTFQDTNTSSPVKDSSCILSNPNLSSFLRRGLVRYEVIVGGQQYPLYPLYIKRIQDDPAKNTTNESFLFELENFFAVNGTAGIIPSVSSKSFEDTRNYFLCNSLNSFSTNLTGNEENFVACFDSSNSVYGLSLAKDDINNFAAGIDSSQSGSVILNLYFDESGSHTFQQLQRPIKINMFCFCDAVFTLQSDANLVRY